MKIISIHNYYQQPGGEDVVFAAERDLLRAHGHTVIEYTDNNKHLEGVSASQTAAQMIWSFSSQKKLLQVLLHAQPVIAHFHNTFLRISPAAYYACQKAGVPVVQSLHNPRLLCPAATFHRRGRVCEDCLGKTFAWPGVWHGCYRGSYLQTASVASMLTVHRWLKTWENQVNRYIVFSEFYRNKFIEGGLPSKKISLKPHFIDPDPGTRKGNTGNYALFIGRLEPAKGVDTLLRAWQHLDGIPLKIRGDGYLMEVIQKFISENLFGSVEIIDRISREELIDLIKRARFLVWPSEGYYENFGMVAIEAFACGTPVIASRTGVMSEIVKHGHSGLHFNPGDPSDLASCVKWAWEHPNEALQMGKRARTEYEKKYTSISNYNMLIEIYQETIARSHSS